LTNYFIAGGCGFIGSSIIHKLLKKEKDCKIICYDNLSTGKSWYLDDVAKDGRLKIIIGDIQDLNLLTRWMKGSDFVYHFASNADIAKAVSDPSIDFWQGTYLTQNILEAMRLNNVKKLVYASGSGIYGDLGYYKATEDYSPMLPTSPYAASKLAGEALISAYSNMFGIRAGIYRFANVVGKYQTHGCAYDFINKLIENPNKLTVMGDGSQSKCYVHVEDILNGIEATQGGIYNIATDTNIAVKEIAEIAVGEMGLTNKTEILYGTEPRGWRGDVPIVRLDSSKLQSCGWKAQYTSEEAIRKSVKEMLELKKEQGFVW
jgi:UDP-glucose 4-epimerase